MKNFISIGQTVAEILQIFYFHTVAARHLEFVKYANFNMNMTHGLQLKSAYLY